MSVPTAVDWEANTHRRETGLIEHVCPHGIGHPNPGSALWIAESIVARQVEDPDASTVEEHFNAWMVHGCDGCCQAETFPGFREALVHMHAVMRKTNIGMVESWRRVDVLKTACLNAGVLVPGEIDKEMLARWREENPPGDFGWRYRLWQVQGFFRDNGAWSRGLWFRRG